MKRIANAFRGLGGLGGNKSNKLFDMYSDQKFEPLLEQLKKMNAKTFTETKMEDLSILHLACMDEEGLPFVKQMATELSYFNEIIDDNSNQDGWTPLMWAVQKGNL
jgi:hypothetical protein